MTKIAAKEGYKKRIQKLGHPDLIEQNTKKLSKLEASRETRKRKNMYIGLLEKKVQDKETEIKKLKQEIQELKSMKEVKNPKFQSNLKQRANLFDSISDSIKRQDQVQTKLCLDILRNKLGVAGQDRENMQYNVLREFVELLMPMHARYLIQACQQKKQFYELFSQNSQYKLHMNFNFLNKQQKKQLSSIRPWLCKYKQSYKNIITQVINLQGMVQEQSILLQQIIDNLQKAFSPCFVAEFLLKLDHKRNNNQIGVIFPINYFEEIIKTSKERKRMQKVNEISNFSLNLNNSQKQVFNEHNIFNLMQDDFDFLL